MALDKQKILSDLGSVVNQLQNADCGCMGKLFNQGQGQAMSSPRCGGGCCHRGHGGACCGEPFPMNQGMPTQDNPFMGGCNPAKAYADGYQFLNQNVMQPVVKEVYEDLKGLNSSNTVTNNPLGAQMGLTQGVPTMPCEGNMNHNQQMATYNASLGGGNQFQDHTMMHHMGEGQHAPGHMNQSAQMVHTNQNSQMANYNASHGGGNQFQGHTMMPQGQPGHMNFDSQMANYNATHGGGNQFQGHTMMAQHGEGQHMPGNMNQNAQMANYNASIQGHEMMPHMPETQQIPGEQHMQGGHQAGGHQMDGNHQMPGTCPMHGYGGQNVSGNASRLANFNKMFPGLTQQGGPGGGLSFNPMEIAMQMNPSLGKQQSGMGTTQNLMSSGDGMKPMQAQPMQPGSIATDSPYSQSVQGYQSQPTSTSGQPPNQTAYAANTGNQLPSHFPPQGNPTSNMTSAVNNHPQMGNVNQGRHGGNYGQHTAGITKFREMFPGAMQGVGDVNFDPMEIAIQMNPSNKQMVAMNTMQKLMSSKPLQPNSAAMQPVINGMNAVNTNFAPVQSATPNQSTDQIPPESQQQAYATNPAMTADQSHPSAEQQQAYTAVTDNQGNQQLPQHSTEQNYQEVKPIHATQGYPNQGHSGRVYQREAIYPVDNALYNTIGQPIELLPTPDFRSEVPQTLPPQGSPFRVADNTESRKNIKSTMSRTSLLARQEGLRKPPSRYQMQQVYNQYKGSQSLTNQNIRVPAQGQSASEGHLNAAPKRDLHQTHQMPVERVGGDSAANHQAYNEAVQGRHVVDQVGDVASNKPGTGNPDPMLPRSPNLRNGLQDIVYTSYPKSTSWSFRGRDNIISRPTTRHRVRV